MFIPFQLIFCFVRFIFLVVCTAQSVFCSSAENHLHKTISNHSDSTLNLTMCWIQLLADSQSVWIFQSYSICMRQFICLFNLISGYSFFSSLLLFCFFFFFSFFIFDDVFRLLIKVFDPDRLPLLQPLMAGLRFVLANEPTYSMVRIPMRYPSLWNIKTMNWISSPKEIIPDLNAATRINLDDLLAMLTRVLKMNGANVKIFDMTPLSPSHGSDPSLLNAADDPHVENFSRLINVRTWSDPHSPFQRASAENHH